MAKPLKDGLDYFPLSTGPDTKMDLVEAEVTLMPGVAAFGTIVKLEKMIHGEIGYYCEWTTDIALLFAKRNGISMAELNETVTAALNRGIFDKNLYEKYQILTSEEIQEIYFRAIKRRTKLNVVEEYLLFPIAKNKENVNKNEVFAHNNLKNVCKSTQSKVKKNKVNESILKESKINETQSAVSSAIKTYEMNIGFPSTIIVQKIEDWLTDVDVSLLEYAIDQAVLHNKKSWSYIEAILRTQFNNGNKTRLSAEAINGRITHSNENPFFKLMKEMEEDDEEGNDFVTVDA